MTILRETDSTAANSTIVLSEEESRRFIAALDAPFEPNDRLRKAMDAAARLLGAGSCAVR